MEPDTGESSMARPHFVVLDGLRGVAALAVACYHVPEVLGGRQWVPHGALAVDFFFMLSGFVIAYSYEERLRSGGLSAGRFIATRSIRLLPMALLGLVLGATALSIGGAVRIDGALAVHALLGVLLLPDPFGNPFSDNILPLNWPSWSLFFELYVGTALAIVAPRLSTRALAMATLVLAFGYAVTAWGWQNANLGWSRWTLGAGFARFGYTFLFGWLLWRLRVHTRSPRVPAAIVAAMLIALFVVPVPMAWTVAFELAAAMLACPVVVALGMACAVGPDGQRWAAWAGRISYPLYMVHAPVLLLIAGFAGGAAAQGLAVPVAIAAAVAALVLYDEPLRRRMTRRMSRCIREAVTDRAWDRSHGSCLN